MLPINKTRLTSVRDDREEGPEMVHSLLMTKIVISDMWRSQLIAFIVNLFI